MEAASGLIPLAGEEKTVEVTEGPTKAWGRRGRSDTAPEPQPSCRAHHGTTDRRPVS